MPRHPIARSFTTHTLALALALGGLIVARPRSALSDPPLTPGNVIFAYADTIREFTSAGVQVRAEYVPPGDGAVANREFPRNMAIDSHGLVHVYNGTLHPWISTWDPTTGAWSHVQVPGLSTAATVAGGGICVGGDALYATDQAVSGSPDQGLVRIGLTDGMVHRFAADRGFEDVDVGPDGLVYGLAVSQDTVVKYDPITLMEAGKIRLPMLCSSIVMASDTSIFGVAYDGGGIRHFARDGTLLGEVGTGDCQMTSIDRFASGAIVATGLCGQVFVTNDQLLAPVTFTADTHGGFVTAVPLATNRPPDCSHAVASVSELWPPNHKLVPVDILGVTDPDGDPVTLTITGVTQNEPQLDPGSGNTCPDALISGSQVSLRSERSGGGSGRFYAISFTADDGKGGVCDGTVGVCVPHDQGHHGSGGACGLAAVPQAYSSLGACAADTSAGPDDQAIVIEAIPIRKFPATVRYTLKNDSDDILLGVYDLHGRRVAVVDAGPRRAGTHETSWSAGNLPSGVYFYRLRSNRAVASRPVLVMK